MRNHDASAHHQRDIERLFLLGAWHAQTVGLDGVIENAIVAAQSMRMRPGPSTLWSSRAVPFQIGVVVDVVEALDQKIIRLVDVRIEALTSLDETAREFTLVGDIFFREQ